PVGAGAERRGGPPGLVAGATHPRAGGPAACRLVPPPPAVPVGTAVLSARSASRKRITRAKGPPISLRLYGKTGRWQAYPATLIPDACTNPGDDETGTIDALLPPAKNVSRMELLLNDKVI